MTRLNITPVVLRQISSARLAGGNQIARRMLSSGGGAHDHSSDLKHFENYRNQDVRTGPIDGLYYIYLI